MNRDFNYTCALQERSVGLGLKLAIFFMPAFFVWLLLGKGYSPRARAIGFGWLIALCGFVFMTSEDTSSPLPNVATTEVSAPQPVAEKSPPVDEEVVKKRALKDAKDALNAISLRPNEDYQSYNERVTRAYHRWANAEEALNGPDWHTKSHLNLAYAECLRTAKKHGFKGAGFWGSLGGDDSPADAACRTVGHSKYHVRKAPTLESYLMKPPTVPVAEYKDTPYTQVSEEVVTASNYVPSQPIASNSQPVPVQAEEPLEVVIYQSEY